MMVQELIESASMQKSKTFENCMLMNDSYTATCSLEDADWIASLMLILMHAMLINAQFPNKANAVVSRSKDYLRRYSLETL